MVHRVNHVVSNQGRRIEDHYEFTNIDENNDVLAQIIAQIAVLTQIAVQSFEQLRLAYPQQGWSMSALLESPEHSRLLQSGNFGSNRRFTDTNQIHQNFTASLLQAIENLTQSERDMELDLLGIVLRFDQGYATVARGRMKSYIRKTIANSAHVGGLAAYDSSDDLCGYQAIVYALALRPELRALWTGDLNWLHSQFKRNEITMQGVKTKSRFKKLGECVKRLLDQTGPWLVNLGADGTTQKFVLSQPRLQIIIYNEVTRQLLDVKRGNLFDIDNPKEASILLSYTHGHLQLIKSAFAYFGKGQDSGEFYCYLCFKIQRQTQHACQNVDQCDKCMVRFNSEEHRLRHCTYELRGKNCMRCSRHFYNTLCLETHQCRAKHVEVCDKCQKKLYEFMPHDCGKYTCATCRESVEQGHRCPIQIEKQPDKLTPNEAGRDYWAFDLESMLLPNDGGYVHQVNLIVCRQCFTETEKVFETMSAFIAWLESFQNTATFFAHNLKGYDGRMVFEYMFDKHCPPQEMLWRGSKILHMEYGKIKFRDTLLHLPASLEQLPAMFGLEPSQFKKGFFPYKFNTPANQAYVGPIPDKKYFEPGNMSTKKRSEFEIWYAQQQAQVYVFKTELVEYCQSDVRILAKAMEAYMIQQMTKHALNPWDSLTIASYAYTMYRTFYMPAEMLYRLTDRESSEIRPAMHGGRTDTRCMLKEWTREQIDAGVYGKYQDVQSLYPTVQFYDPLPIGVPDRVVWLENEQPSVDQLFEVFGFVCCDLDPPDEYLHHPIIVEMDTVTGRLVADLKPKNRITVPTPELHLAMRNGYKVSRVYYWYDFKSSKDLFKSYFRDFLKDKIEASGVPKWVATADDWNEFADYHSQQLGIDLERGDMIPNASRKTGAKLLCNSLWGKFGEKNDPNQWCRFLVDEETDAILALERKWIDGEIDIMHRKYSGDNKAVGMVIKHNNKLPGSHIYNRLRLGKQNIALAAMVTSHARCRLWDELNKLGSRVLYHDTDSIIYERDPQGYNIPEGRYLGEWECETGGLPITKFVSTGPKCYSYVVEKPDGSIKAETKIKGITLHSENSKLINFASMRDLVLGNVETIVTKCLSFAYSRQSGEMVTRDVIKLYRETYAKGHIDRRSHLVYPYGWEKYLMNQTMQPKTVKSRAAEILAAAEVVLQ